MKKLLAIAAVLAFSTVVFAQAQAPATKPSSEELTKKCEVLVKEGKFKTVEECVKANGLVPATK